MSLIEYNLDINPLFPYLCVHPELLNGELENCLNSDTEKVLLAAHVHDYTNEGLVVLSNKRLIIYQTTSKSGFIENFILGSIPGVSELSEIKDTITGVGDNFKMVYDVFNKKAKKRKEAEAQQQELIKMAETLTLPEEELLDSKKFKQIVNNPWNLLDIHPTQIRIRKKKFKFQKRSDIPGKKNWEYYSNLDQFLEFYHEDIGRVLASLFLPNRKLFQKLGWDIFYKGKDLIIANSTNKEINPTSEEIFAEIENNSLFTPTHIDSELVSLSPEDIPNIEPAEFRDAIEAGISFILEADWVKMIQNVYLDRRSYEGLVVLLIEIQPESGDIDNLLWVIGGDFPLTTFAASAIPTSSVALEYYIQEAMIWIACVKGVSDTQSEIFFNLAETEEVAKAFENLIDVLNNKILPDWKTISPS